MQINPQPLPTVLQEAARTFANHPAISFMGKVTTYAQLEAQVNRVAAYSAAHRRHKGTKVGLFLPNTPTFIVYYYAILKAGGTVVNFNPLYTIDELTFQVRDSQTEIMVTHDLAALFPKLETLVQRGVLAASWWFPSPPLPSPKTPALPTTQEEGPGQHRSLAGQGQGDRRRQARRNHHPTEAGRNRPARRRGGAAVHGRHHRHAQRRDADPRQPLRQHRPARGLGNDLSLSKERVLGALPLSTCSR
jgi:acyl-CoA synthetase (AMP-forming)/AMP-acid ligase II